MMYKKAAAVAAIAGFLAVGSTAFADTASTTPVVATSTTSSISSKAACVGAAVNAREAYIDGAMISYTTAINAAHSARASALRQAYADTTLVQMKSDVKAAWAAFATATKTARKTWQTHRNAAWATYRASAVACKAPVGMSDGNNSGIEITGN